MEQIKRYSLSKQVMDQLEKMIEDGKYPIGQKIPTEIELMEMFDVSRNTIREAVQSLTSVGILVVRQGDGTYVQYNNRLDANMSALLKNVSFDEINEARMSLEISMASLASERATQSDIKEIKQALDDRQNSLDDIKEHTLSDINFHMKIAKASHNILLLDLYKSLYSFMYRHIQKRNVATKLSQETISKYHEELFNAIKDGNKDLAVAYEKMILEI